MLETKISKNFYKKFDVNMIKPNIKLNRIKLHFFKINENIIKNILPENLIFNIIYVILNIFFIKKMWLLNTFENKLFFEKSKYEHINYENIYDKNIEMELKNFKEVTIYEYQNINNKLKNFIIENLNFKTKFIHENKSLKKNAIILHKKFIKNLNFVKFKNKKKEKKLQKKTKQIKMFINFLYKENNQMHMIQQKNIFYQHLCELGFNAIFIDKEEIRKKEL